MADIVLKQMYSGRVCAWNKSTPDEVIIFFPWQRQELVAWLEKEGLADGEKALSAVERK